MTLVTADHGSLQQYSSMSGLASPVQNNNNTMTSLTSSPYISSIMSDPSCIFGEILPGLLSFLGGRGEPSFEYIQHSIYFKVLRFYQIVILSVKLPHNGYVFTFLFCSAGPGRLDGVRRDRDQRARHQGRAGGTLPSLRG